MGNLQRALLVLASSALLAATVPPLGLSVNVQRPSNDLLVPVTIAIGLRNSSQTSITASFLTTDLYEVEVRDAGTQIFDSLFGHKPIEIERRIPIPAGNTPLGSLIWDATTNDHRSVAAGTYILRVSILGSVVHPSSDMPIVFATPLPIASARALKEGAGVTIAGISQIVDGSPALVDDDGEMIHLNRLARPRAQGRYIVRGYISKLNGTVVVSVERAVPAFDNLEPEATPPPPGPLKSFPKITPSAPAPRSSRSSR